MTTVWKVLAVLVLILPLTAFVAGTVVGPAPQSTADSQAETALVPKTTKTPAPLPPERVVDRAATNPTPDPPPRPAPAYSTRSGNHEKGVALKRGHDKKNSATVEKDKKGSTTFDNGKADPGGTARGHSRKDGATKVDKAGKADRR